MERYPLAQEHISSEAAEWFAHLQDSEEGATQRAEFVQWLLRSPEHLEEFLAISRVWGESRTASASRFSTDELIADALAEQEPDNVVAFKSTIGSSAVKGGGTHQYRLAAIAAVAALAIATSALLVNDHWGDPSRIRTDIGEQRSVTLADGSVVDINTQSEIRIDLDGTERRMQLVSGEARFKVAKDPRRPFIVSTPQASIRALGTVFNVRAEPERTAVAVLEGRVEVRELVKSTPLAGEVTNIELKAGQQAAVNPAGRILPDAGPPLERVAAWTERRLVFREEPLAEVVAEFNRYHREPIRIEAPELAGLRISGTFDSSDPQSLIEYFARFENVRIERNRDGVRLLPASP